MLGNTDAAWRRWGILRDATVVAGLLGVPRPRASKAGEARWRGFLVAFWATLAVTALLLPAPSRGSVLTYLALMAAAQLCGAWLWLRAARVHRAELFTLSTAGFMLSAALTVIALRHPGGPMTSLAVTRNEWLIICVVLLWVVTAIRQLVIELHRHVQLLDLLARTDPLTQIPNRRAWDEELPRELIRAHRDGTMVTIAILDLDRFKAFNDMRGHQEGDGLLQRIAAGWREAVRASDFIARYGGEEFAVILRGCGLEDALPIIERMRMCVPDEQSCSAGVARWDGEETAETLVGRADEALYEAKLAGRDRVKFAPSRVTTEAVPTTPWPSIVRALLADRSVIAAYQPVVRVDTGDVLAYEALARPNREHLDISVERMFQSAQRMGLGRDLDWLCRRAALAGAGWIPAGTALFINCSVSALLDPVHRVDQMLLVLEAVERTPADVVMEITEREVIEDLNRLRQVVNAYRREGFRFAVDDVGEGHSTLEVLATVQPEFIKIARSLVREAANRGPRAAIRAVVAFAAEIGAQVIAEGIEQPATAAAMLGLGVTLAQGFLFGRPVIPELNAAEPGAVA